MPLFALSLDSEDGAVVVVEGGGGHVAQRPFTSSFVVLGDLALTLALRFLGVVVVVVEDEGAGERFLFFWGEVEDFVEEGERVF